MSFAFRKLYPRAFRTCCEEFSTGQTACPDFSDVGCVPGPTVVMTRCSCPGDPEGTNWPPVRICDQNQTCPSVYRCYAPGWGEGLPDGEGFSRGPWWQPTICVLLAEGSPCDCRSWTQTPCYNVCCPITPHPPNDPIGCVLTNSEWQEYLQSLACCDEYTGLCRPFGYTFDGENGPINPGIRPLFEDCVVSGAEPHTFKIENNVFGGTFSCTLGVSSGSPSNYANFYLQGLYPTIVTGSVGDPGFTKDGRTQRFYKTPNYPAGQTYGCTAPFSTFCIRRNNTDSQDAFIHNRIMIVSGRNVYRYTGPLSGDPALFGMDPFWSATGESGIQQLEESLNRSFPLDDSYLQLPLWGQDENNNLNIGEGVNCIPPYTSRTIGGNGYQVCTSCRCLRTNPDSATGHYLSNDWFNDYNSARGFTAGYFSFACFNPSSYLDHIFDNALGFTGEIVYAGVDNQLGFGNIAGAPGNARINCTMSGDPPIIDDPGTCKGLSGATAHGYRLGVPTCSVWSLVKGLYARILKSFLTNSGLSESNGVVHTEANFRSTYFDRFATAVDNLLNADPSGTTNGTSNVQFHLAKVQEALLLDSQETLSNNSFTVNNDRFMFSFPNVFLWNKQEYKSASATNKWKHLFVIGNGNVVFDSGNEAVIKPYADYNHPDPQPDLHDDVRNQDYKSSIFFLNSVNHSLVPFVDSDTRQARMLVFNGSFGTSGGATASSRRAATSEITLTHIPMCTDFTDAASDEFVSLCSVCNAFPNVVCGRNNGATSGAGFGGCSPVTIITDGYFDDVTCFTRWGVAPVPNDNCLTGSYRLYR